MPRKISIMNKKINLQHMTFSPKYRRPVFKDRATYRLKCEGFIRHICGLKNIGIEEIFIGDDHIHLFLTIPHTMSIAKAAYHIKWFSSCWMRKTFPELQAYPKKDAFWQRNYFVRSVGGEAAAVRKYIERHRKPC